MSDKLVLKDEFLIELQGKKFVTYQGLLDMGHQIGIKSMDTSILQYPTEENGFIAITKTEIITKDGDIYSDIGDASPSSVNSMVTPHLIRMSSTRSKARALRDLTNVGITALEELGGDDVGEPDKSVPTTNVVEDNKLIMEAKDVQDKLVSGGKVTELGHITNGRKLTDLKGAQLKECLEKAKKLL